MVVPANRPPIRHPLGDHARVLLSSVFGPYARDDEYGSRALNPMELYHNQVTRTQGVFSLRMFHRSWGLMLIQENIEAPCTLLDFPTLDRFVDELHTAQYDIVGIGAIQPNLLKVQKMCALVRQHQPQATIVVGGHVANFRDIERVIDADHVVRGEGVSWFRSFLGEDDARPIRHPRIPSGFGARILGVPLSRNPKHTAATLIPSVGCPKGCNFCSTSAMFGGKGHSVNFFATGDDLFAVMCDLERDMHVRAFFVMDENFLLYRRRALRLLELMREHDKAWSLYVFSSADALRRYTIDELVGLGVSWVWLGLEGENSRYTKLHDIDTMALVRTLQAHGIRVLGSTIIGLEDHTPENIDAAIDHAVRHDTEFHQFMLYTPMPGTPLYEEHRAQGTLLDDAACAVPDAHGQFKFRHRHANIPAGRETEYLLRAFERDFAQNGPSIARIARTLVQGWRKLKDHAESRVRRRVANDCAGLAIGYSGALWASQRWLADNPHASTRTRTARLALVKAYGWRARLAGPLLGPFLLMTMRWEAARLRRGWRWEPPTFYDLNAAARSLRATTGAGSIVPGGPRPGRRGTQLAKPVAPYPV